MLTDKADIVLLIKAAAAAGIPADQLGAVGVFSLGHRNKKKGARRRTLTLPFSLQTGSHVPVLSATLLHQTPFQPVI